MLNNSAAPASAHVIDLKKNISKPSEAPLLQDEPKSESPPAPAKVAKFNTSNPTTVSVNSKDVEPKPQPTSTEPEPTAEPTPVESKLEAPVPPAAPTNNVNPEPSDPMQEQTALEQAESNMPKKRKPLRIILIVLGVLVLAATIGAGVVYVLSMATAY